MSQPSLLDQVRAAIRVRHYSIRTEEAYVNVIRRFILYHQKRHLREMGVDEIWQYLSHLATDGNEAASTQNVALAALLFLYREVCWGSTCRSSRASRAPNARNASLSSSLRKRSDGSPRT